MTKLFDNPALNQRQLGAQTNPFTGFPVFSHTLTESCFDDTVDCVVRTLNLLPIIFVPGIMGSNLKSIGSNSEAVWRLDSGGGAMFSKMFKTAGDRQRLLHPARTVVDERGALPSESVGILTKPEEFKARYWGEVSAISYQAFLIWLEMQLNGAENQSSGSATQIVTGHSALNAVLAKVQNGSQQWGAKKPFEPLSEDESKKSLRWYYPVYACGYNWLGDNKESAQRLAQRIKTVIERNNRPLSRCEQVILVTHSMGGLVARACSLLKGMESKIAGIVHGVMPTTGAAVAYRRCKVGMKDEGATGASAAAILSWGGNLTIGNTGQEITAVFAQAPGALQRLPTAQYAQRNWLQVCNTDASLLPEQPDTSDPYTNVYTERIKWWGLVKEEWLKPEAGEPIDWGEYKENITQAKKFHTAIQDYYHPNTLGFYGSRVASFAQIRWTLHPEASVKSASHPPEDTTKLTHTDIPLGGANPEGVPGKTIRIGSEPYVQEIKTRSYTLRLGNAADSGDGTVPVVSGDWPVNPVQSSKVQQRIQQFFEVPGVEHEPAYKNPVTQHITVYAINKIASKVPQPKQK